MKSLDALLQDHAFFQGLDPAQIHLIAGCGQIRHYAADAFLAREGTSADDFFVIRRGRVAIETHVPGRDAVTLETLQEHEIAGWSWLFPPYHWMFDIRAVEATSVIALDGKCLRGKCEADHELGYRLMQRFSSIMISRLRAARMQVLDVYGRGQTVQEGAR